MVLGKLNEITILEMTGLSPFSAATEELYDAELVPHTTMAMDPESPQKARVTQHWLEAPKALSSSPQPSYRPWLRVR